MNPLILLKLILISIFLISCSSEEKDWFWSERQECFNKYGTSTYVIAEKKFVCRSRYEPNVVIYEKDFFHGK